MTNYVPVELNTCYFATSASEEYNGNTISEFPAFKKYQSIDGFNKEEVISECRNLDIPIKRNKDNGFIYFGELASSITQIKLIKSCFEFNNKFCVILEDYLDLIMPSEQIMTMASKKYLNNANDELWFVKFGNFGEAYSFSAEGSEKTLEILKDKGISKPLYLELDSEDYKYITCGSSLFESQPNNIRKMYFEKTEIITEEDWERIENN